MVHRLAQILQSYGIGTYYAVYYACYLGAVAVLGLVAFRHGRRLRPWILSLCRCALLLLVARLALFGNPISFHYFVRSTGAAEIGYRQYDAVMLEIARFRRDLDTGERPSFLAVGSSQVAGIFYVWNSAYPDPMEVFSLAGMRPIDYVLYRDYIGAYRPRAVVLYLSGGDFALVPDLRSMSLVPSAPTLVPVVLNRLRKYGLTTGDNLPAIHDYLAVQVLPEYRWAFLFHDWIRRQTLRASAAIGPVAGPAAPAPARVPPPDEGAAAPTALMLTASDPPRGLSPSATVELPAERLARFEESYEQRWMPLYLSFLEDFVRFCESRGIPVLINEGQFNPAAMTPKMRDIQALGVRALRDLSRRHPSVRFISASEVYQFDASEYSDLVHVHSDAAARYTRQFGEYLHRYEALASRASCTYEFNRGWHAIEWQDGQHWLRWSDGTGELELQTPTAAEFQLEVDVLPAVRPNAITVTVNDRPVLSRDVTDPDFSFIGIGPVTFTAAAGRNVLRFDTREAAATGGDQRPRSLAIRNLRLRRRPDAGLCLPDSAESSHEPRSRDGQI